MEDASVVEELMRLQWSNLVMPGLKVKVVSAVVSVECNCTSKLSFDCLYCYATAKANVKLSGPDFVTIAIRSFSPLPTAPPVGVLYINNNNNNIRPQTAITGG